MGESSQPARPRRGVPTPAILRHDRFREQKVSVYHRGVEPSRSAPLAVEMDQDGDASRASTHIQGVRVGRGLTEHRVLVAFAPNLRFREQDAQATRVQAASGLRHL